MPGRQDGSDKEQRSKQTDHLTENAFGDDQQQSWGELNYNFQTEAKEFMKMGQWLRVRFEYFLFLEWKGGQFPAPSWGESKLTLTPFIEVPKPFSGLCRNVCA